MGWHLFLTFAHNKHTKCQDSTCNAQCVAPAHSKTLVPLEAPEACAACPLRSADTGTLGRGEGTGPFGSYACPFNQMNVLPCCIDLRRPPQLRAHPNPPRLPSTSWPNPAPSPSPTICRPKPRHQQWPRPPLAHPVSDPAPITSEPAHIAPAKRALVFLSPWFRDR